MASYRLDVRLLLRDGRDVSAGKVRRLIHHMLQLFGRFGRPVGLTLGELGARWYPEQSLPAAGRVTIRLKQSRRDLRRTTRVANIKSQQKRNLTNERRRLRNKSVK